MGKFEWKELVEIIPGNHSRQVSIDEFAVEIIDSSNYRKVVDLGCEDGRFADFF